MTLRTANPDPSALSLSAGFPLVYIVILNWNGTTDTLACLASLQTLSYPSFRVVVIDNGSIEPCTGIVREQFPDTEVIESASNQGFTGGSNLGLRLAFGRGADYVWLLNNDTLVDPDALSAMVHAVEADDVVGIAGSKIYFAGQDRVIDHAGGAWDSKSCDAVHLGNRELDVGQYDEVSRPYFVTGCSLLVRRKLIEEIGWLDDGLFAYLEDVDFCTRARRAGWDVVYVPSSVVHHKGGTVAEPSRAQHYLYARNRLKYTSNHHPRLLPRAIVHWTRDCVVGPAITGRYHLLGPSLRAFGDWILRRGGGPS